MAGGGVGGVARRRALASRLSVGHVVMVLAGVLGVLFTLNVLRAADHTRPMLAAARDIVPGTVLGRHSLQIVRVQVNDKVLATLFDASELDRLRGDIVVAHMSEGALVTRDAVRKPGAGAAPRAMSFPIARSHAVGGTLVVGDRIDVLSVHRTTGVSAYVATDVQVLAFASRSSGPLQGSDDASITIAIDSAAASRIASAQETGSITLVRSTGATPIGQPASGTAPR